MMAAARLVFLVLVGQVAPTAAQLPQLNIVGSSTVWPIVRQWAYDMRDQYTYYNPLGTANYSNTASSNCKQGAWSQKLCPGSNGVNCTVCSGGSGAGLAAACWIPPLATKAHIGTMSRDFASNEAYLLDDGWTWQCVFKNSKARVSQMNVALDGISVIVSNRGIANDCVMRLGGLTAAQIRWMFSNWTADLGAANPWGGVDLTSIAPNDNNNGIKEWSDLHKDCAAVPIHTYGPGNVSGTAQFFGEKVMSLAFMNFGKVTPPASVPLSVRENYNVCQRRSIDALLWGQVSQTNKSDQVAWLQANRNANVMPRDCYMPSERDDLTEVAEWVAGDPQGIGYFGYAYASQYAARLNLVRVASDFVKGAQDTKEAFIAPSAYSITDGSYSVLRRYLHAMVVDDSWWVVTKFLQYGYSDNGTEAVKGVGYVGMNAALRAKSLQKVAAGGNVRAQDIILPPTTCPTGSEMLTIMYLNQWNDTKVNYTCSPCPPGTAKANTQPIRCLACNEGTYTDSGGQSACTSCLPGTFAVTGSTACVKCPKNTIAPMPGQGECDLCPAGQITSGGGMVQCDRCPQGTFRSQNDSLCITCPEGMTTAFRAAPSRDSCGCAEGTYHAPGGRYNGPCLQCLEGMTCPFASMVDNFANWSEDPTLVIPLLKEDYWSDPSAPLSVYECKVAVSTCPGGGPGSCTGGRVGRVCAVCPDNYVAKDDECKECGSGFTAMPILLPIGTSILVVAAYYTTNSPLTSNVSITSAIAMSVSFVVTIAQLLGMFKDLNVKWDHRSQGLFEGLALSLASPKTISYECVLGSSAVLKYGMRCLVPVALVCNVLLLYLISYPVACIRPSVRRWDWDKTINTLSQVLQAVFIGIAGIMTVPLQCYQHPNKEKSLNQFPEVLCWEGGDHNALVTFGALVALLFVLPFCAFCVYGTMRVVQPGRPGATVRFRFLLFRFRPDVWWWGNVFMARQILLVFAPSLPAETPHAQSIYVIAVFIFYGFAQAHFWPWKSPEFNMLDVLISASLVVIIVTSTAFLEAPSDVSNYQALLGALLIMMAIGCSFIFIGVLYYGCRYKSPSAGFGHTGLATHDKIAQQFYELCSAVKELGVGNCKATLDDMSYYDRAALRTSIASYQACNPHTCPSGQLAKARLAGVPRSDSSGSLSKGGGGSGGSGRMTDKWKERRQSLTKGESSDASSLSCSKCGRMESSNMAQSTVMV